MAAGVCLRGSTGSWLQGKATFSGVGVPWQKHQWDRAGHLSAPKDGFWVGRQRCPAQVPRADPRAVSLPPWGLSASSRISSCWAQHSSCLRAMAGEGWPKKGGPQQGTVFLSVQGVLCGLKLLELLFVTSISLEGT